MTKYATLIIFLLIVLTGCESGPFKRTKATLLPTYKPVTIASESEYTPFLQKGLYTIQNLILAILLTLCCYIQAFAACNVTEYAELKDMSKKELVDARNICIREADRLFCRVATSTDLSIFTEMTECLNQAKRINSVHRKKFKKDIPDPIDLKCLKKD